MSPKTADVQNFWENEDLKSVPALIEVNFL